MNHCLRVHVLRVYCLKVFHVVPFDKFDYTDSLETNASLR